MPKIVRVKRIVGNRLQFLDVATEDSEFIVKLRRSVGKSEHISKTSADVDKQIMYTERYQRSVDTAYFVICDVNGNRLGTVRLSDPQRDSFSWGSWILRDGSPTQAGIESAMMVYRFGVDYLGFRSAHFGVRRGNRRVRKFHERLGADRTHEDDSEIHYRMEHVAISASLAKYRRYLPGGITVEPYAAGWDS